MQMSATGNECGKIVDERIRTWRIQLLGPSSNKDHLSPIVLVRRLSIVRVNSATSNNPFGIVHFLSTFGSLTRIAMNHQLLIAGNYRAISTVLMYFFMSKLFHASLSWLIKKNWNNKGNVLLSNETYSWGNIFLIEIRKSVRWEWRRS